MEVAIELAGVCGSDISGFLGHSARRKPPLVLGHESIGRLNDGRRVVANPLITCGHCVYCLAGAQNLCESWRLLGMDQTPGTFAEYVTLPAGQIHEIPEELPSVRAVLCEPLANIVHLFRISAPAPFFRLGIVGGGTMGALTLLASHRIGARDVLVVDVSAQRLETAMKLGAAAAANTASRKALWKRSAWRAADTIWWWMLAGPDRRGNRHSIVAAGGMRRTAGYECAAERTGLRHQHTQRAPRGGVVRIHSGRFPARVGFADCRRSGFNTLDGTIAPRAGPGSDGTHRSPAGRTLKMLLEVAPSR